MRARALRKRDEGGSTIARVRHCSLRCNVNLCCPLQPPLTAILFLFQVRKANHEGIKVDATSDRKLKYSINSRYPISAGSQLRYG